MNDYYKWDLNLVILNKHDEEIDFILNEYLKTI